MKSCLLAGAYRRHRDLLPMREHQFAGQYQHWARLV